MNNMRLMIIRHGETKSNKDKILQGHLPIPLSENGFAQAEAIANRLAKTNIDIIYTSDLIRAKQTAEAIARHHPHTKLVEDKRLRERDLGDYVGKSIDSVEWPKDSTTRVPNGESRVDHHSRLESFYNEILEKHPEDTVIIVTHRGSVLLLMNIIRKGPVEEVDFSYRIKNTSVTEFEIGEGVTEITLNCDKHLTDE